MTLIGENNIKKLNDKKIISIGPITSNTIEDFGVKIYKEADEATIDSMIDIISNDKKVLMGDITC